MKKFKYISSCAVLLLAGLSSCGNPSFKIEGEIEGADGGSVVLQKSDWSGYWIDMDSTRLSGSGHFSMKSPAPDAPQIYRLVYDGRYVYFPVDSVEKITLSAKATDFDRQFTLAGSEQAELLERLEKAIIAYAPYASVADSAEAFKRRIYTNFLQDSRGSVVGYYALTKTVGGKPLFGEFSDYKYFAAVATGFRQYRPDDPRTAMLEKAANDLRRKHNSDKGKKTVLNAQQINLIEISLPDADGTPVSLSGIAGGRPLLLMFAALTDDVTPAINAKLRTGFDTGRYGVYQVGMDDDQLAWRTSAKNLPWITVYGGRPADARELAMKYQISELPTYFIIDAGGNLTDRAATLDEALSKLR